MGEDPDRVAGMYGVTVPYLRRMNPWMNPYSFPVDVWIIVGVSSPSVGACTDFQPVWHAVLPGDTWPAICTRYGVSLEYVMRLNPWCGHGALMPGARVVVIVNCMIPTAPPMPPMPTMPPCMPPTLTWHQLMPGDTFFLLAQRFNTTVECLEALNSWADPLNLPVGCWIVVSLPMPEMGCAHMTLNWHQLVPGDTFFNLAARFGTTVECLQAWNSWAVPTNLPVGCWVVVGASMVGPTPTMAPCGGFVPTWHQLVPGDTFFHLAQRFNTTVDCLERLNSWANPLNLPVGCWVAVGTQPALNCNTVTLTWHQLVAGDTFFNLAARFGTTVECLQAWNSWAVPTNLPVGCWVVVGATAGGVVPPTVMPFPCGFRPMWHQLIPGDTFFLLSRRYNTTVDCLQRMNSWADPLNLPVGCWVVVSITSPAAMQCGALRWHQIMPGDTFFALAQRFGTTVECLQVWNSWAVATNLPVGCWLVVGSGDP